MCILLFTQAWNWGWISQVHVLSCLELQGFDQTWHDIFLKIITIIFNQSLAEWNDLVIYVWPVLALVPTRPAAWSVADGEEGAVIRADSWQGQPFPYLQDGNIINWKVWPVIFYQDKHTQAGTPNGWKLNILDFSLFLPRILKINFS